MSHGWIITFATAVVAVCAILAAYGFRGRVTTVGIDLGTTFSVVGVNLNGKVKIIEDEKGRRLFPSIVTYLDDGEILSCHDALPHLNLNPKRTIYNSKRFIGKSLLDSDVVAYAASHPFSVVSSNISQFGQVAFQINVSNTVNLIAPESVGTQILKYLLQVTAKYLGHDQVNKAVIAVPARFNSEQRAATALAYKQAGLKVVRVMEEPTAAAVAYQLHKKSNIQHILVYDFGGGTLDVSILYVSKGSVQVYATDGDDNLGGSDMDICLYDYLKQQIEVDTSVPLPESTTSTISTKTRTANIINEKNNNNNNNGSSDQNSSSVNVVTVQSECVTAGVRIAAEEIKKLLSHQDAVEYSCIANSADEKIPHYKISRLQFESICGAVFDKAMTPVHRLLHDLDMSPRDIDEVVLVGGSTRIPKIKADLRAIFGKELNDHIDPDITVAYGAASILD